MLKRFGAAFALWVTAAAPALANPCAQAEADWALISGSEKCAYLEAYVRRHGAAGCFVADIAQIDAVAACEADVAAHNAMAQAAQAEINAAAQAAQAEIAAAQSIAAEQATRAGRAHEAAAVAQRAQEEMSQKLRLAIEELTQSQATVQGAQSAVAATQITACDAVDRFAASYGVPPRLFAAGATCADLQAEAQIWSELNCGWAAEVAALRDQTCIAALPGDPVAGARVFRQCRACHQVGETAVNRTGPILNAIVGRPAAIVEGFAYSSAMQGAAANGLVWTPEAIDNFLKSPRRALRGTTMGFRGLRRESDRQNLIAYLATLAE